MLVAVVVVMAADELERRLGGAGVSLVVVGGCWTLGCSLELGQLGQDLLTSMREVEVELSPPLRRSEDEPGETARSVVDLTGGALRSTTERAVSPGSTSPAVPCGVAHARSICSVSGLRLSKVARNSSRYSGARFSATVMRSPRKVPVPADSIARPALLGMNCDGFRAMRSMTEAMYWRWRISSALR